MEICSENLGEAYFSPLFASSAFITLIGSLICCRQLPSSSFVGGSDAFLKYWIARPWSGWGLRNQHSGVTLLVWRFSAGSEKENQAPSWCCRNWTFLLFRQPKCFFREFHFPAFKLAVKKNIARASHQIVAAVGSFMLIMSACCDDKAPLWTWSCLTAHLVTHLLTLSEGLLYPSLGH